MRSNCLFWAVREWKRNNWEGYLILRKSRHHKLKWLWWPHFLYLRDSEEITERALNFVPYNAPERILPPILFRGFVQTGDK